HQRREESRNRFHPGKLEKVVDAKPFNHDRLPLSSNDVVIMDSTTKEVNNTLHRQPVRPADPPGSPRLV
ncbi:MAG: hypothetical protein OXI33_08165, partial [Chloroflexota bacterium]|nr:hypothetical protein [Chloroflexota bacterium]